MDIVVYVAAPTEEHLKRGKETRLTMSRKRAERYAARLHRRYAQRPYTKKVNYPATLLRLIGFPLLDLLYTLQDALVFIAHGKDEEGSGLAEVEVQRPSRTSSNPTRPTPSKSEKAEAVKGEWDGADEKLTRMRKEAEERLATLTKRGRILPD